MDFGTKYYRKHGRPPGRRALCPAKEAFSVALPVPFERNTLRILTEKSASAEIPTPLEPTQQWVTVRLSPAKHPQSKHFALRASRCLVDRATTTVLRNSHNKMPLPENFWGQ